ncbi:hypothetical protein BL250_01470 [Erwinia sp. OLTSP20]|uniref:DUF445 domain-containing protein n=1 Tax=unclassified Erwinia TaxID=2622719 RepID=UPI000C17F90F|nr:MULTISPECIES: DUF445 family protein [unclassified Erwinia]PIJ50994.1 hypothetical protein BV501_05670 [Erwinia sp. OAMSP11]PIJ73738.1 hypothetical protein BK416_06430 [Erwinia sp. OLSSP12]PIJ83095.1 hypothetical protein BLD47_05925 [Erwinia sp. OLCASP19]PIJ85693.1 hypothetical protein BLD46_05955 [Erwinia sp. OLMTSP26]PIJ87656.1 hypothetical protein BLD49_05160 [Erwinia sp. OLMDSP33]
MTDHKERELRRAKLWPGLMLLAAAAAFLFTLIFAHFYPADRLWLAALKAVAEASMVGALADWFAVSALFHPIPLPLIGRHTAIVPNNKARIADNLAAFVEEKFLNADALLTLIRRYDPAQMAARWLSEADNARQLSRYLLRVMRGLLDMADDARIQDFIRRAVHQAIDKVDLSQSAALILESLTRNGRHQALLDDALKQLLQLINQPATHDFIAREVVTWLKRDHPWKEKMLPSEWLGEKSAELAADAVASMLTHIEQDRSHVLRSAFNRSVNKFIVRLRNDTEMAARAQEIKRYLKEDEALNSYIRQLWDELRHWLKQDLASDNPQMDQRLQQAARWFGETLRDDPALRQSLNQHLENAAERAAPDFSAFLSRHISDTVKSWDARDMAHQVELNIGKDLQRIRINGTLVGGAIGLLLFFISHFLPRWL